MIRSARLLCLSSLLLWGAVPARGQQTADDVRAASAAAMAEAEADAASVTGEADEAPDPNDAADTPDDTTPELAVTQHVAVIDGQQVAYTATAGKMLIKNDELEAKAYVFFVAYTKDDPEADPEADPDDGADDSAPASDRPVTFCFNGGPGASSVWLHLGMLGPQRVTFGENAERSRPPQKLEANPFSLLDITDLVFIDPVSTGYSRPAEGEEKSQFHGYDEDVRSIGHFIHDYTTRYGRWGSPKFLLGESYGGLRAAGLSGELQRRYHMYLNGIVMVSGVFDFKTIRSGRNNDLPHALFLPSYAATAWYHRALSEPLQNLAVQDVVARAEAFAKGVYLQALLAGDALPAADRRRVVTQMSELTGLSTDYLDRANLRVSMGRFGKELLRSRRQVVGRFDSRYTGTDRDAAGESAGHDPSGAAFFGPFTAAMNQYLRDELEVEEERVYEILTGKVHPWDYSEFTGRYVDASETLRRAMAQNPFLKVFAACGYYDLATPHFAMEHARDHLGLSPELRKNFTTAFYEGGHMMYVHEPSLKKLRDDLVKFYASALGADR